MIRTLSSWKPTRQLRRYTGRCWRFQRSFFSRPPALGIPAGHAGSDGRGRQAHAPDERHAGPGLGIQVRDSREPGSDRDLRGGRVLRFTRVVTVRRPDALFSRCDGSGETALDVSAYYDDVPCRSATRRVACGRRRRRPARSTRCWTMSPDGTRCRSPSPTWSTARPTDRAFIGRTTKGGFVGRETIDGVRCAHLSYSDEFVDVQVWVPSAGQPLPRRVRLVYKAPGAPAARIDFARWDLGPDDCRRDVHVHAGRAHWADHLRTVRGRAALSRLGVRRWARCDRRPTRPRRSRYGSGRSPRSLCWGSRASTRSAIAASTNPEPRKPAWRRSRCQPARRGWESKRRRRGRRHARWLRWVGAAGPCRQRSRAQPAGGCRQRERGSRAQSARGRGQPPIAPHSRVPRE